MSRVDLHVHTTASDGRHRPAEVVRMARDAYLTGIAVTDHDTVAGLEEAFLAGGELGILVVPGVEISTESDGKDIHILGYGFRRDDPKLLERLAAQRRVRETRNEAIVAKLRELGVLVAYEEVLQAASAAPRGDGSVGRPHIAEVLVARGYARDIRDAFNRYLAEGAAAYVSPPRIEPLEAVRWIHEAGGKAIVAHPGLYRRDDLVVEWLQRGADGLEAYHSDHDESQQGHYKTLAKSRGKLVTGGSDFHGSREGVVFHGHVGHRTVDAAVIDQLLAKRETE